MFLDICVATSHNVRMSCDDDDFHDEEKAAADAADDDDVDNGVHGA